MKNTLRLLILFTLFSQFGYAQEITFEDNKTYTNYKNEVSFDALQVINGVYQFGYERYIWNNLTASLSLGYKGKEGLVKISGLDGEKIKTGDVFYTGYQIIPEVRYYLKNTAHSTLTGFYFGAYLKYSNYKSDLDGSYINSEDVSYVLKFDLEVDVTSIGFMVGYKLPISKHFNIDFIIAGPGSGHYNFRLKNEQDLPEEFYEDLNAELEDYTLLDIINSDFEFSQVNNNSKFSALSFRYGISIGYTFN
ncbi:DUF3575 domain-containing protein [Formosa sp. PL04]|uniref:DUF3575 domain-containing protein n=1 Tax=Formosa sp. PL04 TaxID=3081755 RepID=UPI002980A368|nr:DUF3575 domain-containing protein [Formosa sp. PL04]MDW5288675.1 DUF3575 domain-containing protein [Formosa sp. PL04]